MGRARERLSSRRAVTGRRRPHSDIGRRAPVFRRDTEGNVFGPNPAELWTSNGTATGTKLVRDFLPEITIC